MSPIKTTHPGSPTVPMLASPSTKLPLDASSARSNVSYSANDTSAQSHTASGALPRSSSMMFTPGTGPQSQPPPQPSLANLPHRSESSSNLPLDGFEPRIFPGVVSRPRRSSVQRPGSSSMSDTDGPTSAWSRRTEGDSGPKAVVEEPDDVDDNAIE